MLQNPKVFGVNISDIAHAKELLEKETLLDRLPHQQSLSGLKLLRGCWDEHDIIVHLANRYKLASHVMYTLLLALGVVIIVLVCVQTRANAYYDIEFAVSSLSDSMTNVSDSKLEQARFTA